MSFFIGGGGRVANDDKGKDIRRRKKNTSKQRRKILYLGNARRMQGKARKEKIRTKDTIPEIEGKRR